MKYAGFFCLYAHNKTAGKHPRRFDLSQDALLITMSRISLSVVILRISIFACRISGNGFANLTLFVISRLAGKCAAAVTVGIRRTSFA